MTSATIVFDLDGTLVDTAPDLVDTLNTILHREGARPVPYVHGRALVGHGARHMIQHGLAAGGLQADAEMIDRLFDGFIVHYRAHIADRSRPFPGVEAALDALAARGHQLAVCTNKLESLSVQLLEALGMAERFRAICGADTVSNRKPHPDHLLQTIDRAGGHPARAIMIGDSETDIKAARAAAIPVIAVDFGYTNGPVADHGPDRVVNSFERLPETVAELLKPGLF